MWSDPQAVAAGADDDFFSLKLCGYVVCGHAAEMFDTDYRRFFAGASGTDDLVIFAGEAVAEMIGKVA